MLRRRHPCDSYLPCDGSLEGTPRPARSGFRMLVAVLGTTIGVVAMGVGSAAAAEHKVRSGENLTTIARRYGVSTSELAHLNHLADPNRLLVGTVLQVPPAAGRTLAAPAAWSSSLRSMASTPDRAGGSRSAPAVPYFTLPLWERRAVAQQLSRAAVEFGVSPSLLKALTYTESRWRQDVVSASGAIGVGQLLPETARWLAQQMGEPELDPTVRRDNIRMSAFLLRYLLDHTRNRRAALASYYQGLSAVLALGVSRGGARYAATISARRTWFS
jgi:murein DD-endopeptidase MepM/ murein hydrolase activator NlpD